MIDFNAIRQRDQLPDRMCRESDAVVLATWMVHVLVVCVVVVGSIWTLRAVRGLRDDSERWEAELLEFQRLSVQAARSPRRDARRVAVAFSRRIAEQTWHSSLSGVRPRVLQTPSGLRVRFARTIPAAKEPAVR